MSREIAYLKRAGRSFDKGDLLRAEVDYTKALRIEPKSAEARLGRAKVYAALGKTSHARADRAAASGLTRELVGSFYDDASDSDADSADSFGSSMISLSSTASFARVPTPVYDEDEDDVLPLRGGPGAAIASQARQKAVRGTADGRFPRHEQNMPAPAPTQRRLEQLRRERQERERLDRAEQGRSEKRQLEQAEAVEILEKRQLEEEEEEEERVEEERLQSRLGEERRRSESERVEQQRQQQEEQQAELMKKQQEQIDRLEKKLLQQEREQERQRQEPKRERQERRRRQKQRPSSSSSSEPTSASSPTPPVAGGDWRARLEGVKKNRGNRPEPAPEPAPAEPEPPAPLEHELAPVVLPAMQEQLAAFDEMDQTGHGVLSLAEINQAVRTGPCRPRPALQS